MSVSLQVRPFTPQEARDIKEAFVSSGESFDRLNAALEKGDLYQAVLMATDLLTRQEVTVNALKRIREGIQKRVMEVHGGK